MSLPKQIKSKFVQRSSGGSVADSVTVFDFTDISSFTYSAALVGSTLGTAQLINQYGPNAYFVATFRNGTSANWSREGGKLGASIIGTAGITSGYLGFNGVTAARLMFDTNLNFPETDAYTVRFKVILGYTGVPASEQRFLSQARNEGDGNWLTDIRQESETNLRTTISDNSSTKGLAGAFASPKATFIEYAGSFNWATGDYRQFAYGSLVGSAGTGAGSRAPNGRIYWIGQNYDNNPGHIANFGISDLICYDAQLYTGTTYTVGYTLPEVPFPTNDPTVETNAVTMNTIVSFTAVSKASGSDAIQGQVRVGGQLKYYNSGWVNSDGTYAQSNSLATIASNISTLTAGSSVAFRMHLHSNAGTSTPYLDSITVEYT